jgi:hypothetical protein
MQCGEGAFEREALVFGGIIVDAIGADAIVFWPMSALLSVGSLPVPAGKGGLVKELRSASHVFAAPILHCCARRAELCSIAVRFERYVQFLEIFPGTDQ